MGDPYDINWRVVVVVACSAAVAFVGALTVATMFDVSASALTRDLQATAGLPWYVGSLSMLGVVAWASSSAVALAASTIVLPDRAGFLRGLGALGFVLALDDAFMVHEGIAPDRLEPLLYVLYAAAAVHVVRRSSRISGTARVLGAGALASLGISAGADAVGLLPAFAEDGAKFVGIICWSAVALLESRSAVRLAVS